MMDFFQKACRAFGDSTRLQIFKLLLTKSFCVNALAKELDISQSAVSQHLRVLREAGLAESEKEGYFVHYFVSREGLERFAEETEKLVNECRARGCPRHGLHECGCNSKE